MPSQLTPAAHPIRPRVTSRLRFVARITRWSVPRGRSLDNPWDLEEIPFPRGRIRKHLVRRRAIGDLVLAIRGAGLANLGRRLDLPRVEFVELIDIGENRAQLDLKPLFLRGREFQPRQPRDALRLLDVYFLFGHRCFESYHPGRAIS